MNICHYFRDIVNRLPDKVALISESEGDMSYRQLDYYSNYIASIIDDSCDECCNVGVSVNRSFLEIASILGIIKAGRTYVPIDPEYPSNYIQRMTDRSDVDLIVCGDKCTNSQFEGYKKLQIPQYHDNASISKYTIKNRDEACILFTSGSTDYPKGVVMEHNSILNTINWAINYYQLTPDDISLQVPSCSFTSSVQDIFSTLLSGGTLVILEDAKVKNVHYLFEQAKKFEVTHFDMVPSLYAEFLNVVDITNLALRFVLVAGEPLAISVKNKHFSVLQNVRLVNEYGMAETCSCAFFKEIFSNTECITIGDPITNMDYRIAGGISEGELLISGPGLAKEYYGDSFYTNEKFIIHDGIRHLRTGDFVKKTPDGITYIGRLDKQVKINGKRIGIAEIEKTFLLDENVEDARIVPLVINNKQRLICFLRTSREDVAYYYNYSKKELPYPYRPTLICIVSEFDRLPNGKIDLIGMAEKAWLNIKGDNINVGNSEIEKDIINKLNEVDDAIIITDTERDLREYGIDSLTLIQLLIELEDYYSIEFDYDYVEKTSPLSIKVLSNNIKALTVDHE